jgi:hypothetical protein
VAAPHWSHHYPPGTKPSEFHQKVRREASAEWNKRYGSEKAKAKDRNESVAIYHKHRAWMKTAEAKAGVDPTKSVAQHYADLHQKELDAQANAARPKKKTTPRRKP